MFYHPCAPRVLFSGLFALVLFVTLAVGTAADSFGQDPPITPSEGWNTQVSHPLSLPSSDIQYDITGGTRPGGASGTSLFHSFGDFNVPTNNIVNFLNAGSIDLNGNVLPPNLPTSNILGRVTGGDPSVIFGMIQTNGPNGFGAANLFLINPAGFLFGPNATVNVGGMVSFTTADYLRLTDATFNAVPNTVDDALLTAMPVAAFGFLGPNAASIVVQGSTLKVAEGQALSLIGGNRSFGMATETATGNFVPSGEVSPPGVVIAGGTLSAPSGHISIVSVDSAGEVIPAPPNESGGLNVSSFSDLGRVELSEGTMVDVSTMLDADFNPVSTQGNGTVSIRAGQLVLNTTSITALNFGATDGATSAVNIDVQSDTTVNRSSIQTFTLDTAGGDITITSGSLALTESEVFAGTSGVGSGGDIAISTTGPISITTSFVQATSETDGAVGSINISATSANGSITVGEGGLIRTVSGPQNGGAIMVQADQNVTIENGGIVVTSAPLIGTAGDITITAGETVTVSGPSDTHYTVIATSASGGDDPTTTSKAGDILITATNVLLQDNAQIDSEALAAQPGNLTITATDSVSMSGGSRIRLGVRDQSGGAIDISAQSVSMSSASIRTRAGGSGDAGAITLNGTTLTLTDSQIAASTHASGRGGDVLITAQKNLDVNGQFTDESGDVSPAGVFSQTFSSGDGGNITLTAGQSFAISTGASVSASSTGTGNAGNIDITAGSQFRMTNSSVTTEATQSGGGAIKITTDPSGTVQLTNSTISASVLDGTGGGGSVNIDPQFVILANSHILATAVQGAGGNIFITTTLLLPDGNSVISASSQFGQSGTVTIQSPNAPISGQIHPLGKAPLLATSLFNQQCASVAGGQFSSFTVGGRNSVPTEPGSWLTSPLAMAGVEPRLKAEGGMGEGLSGVSDVVRAGLAAHQTDQRDKTDQSLLSLRQIAPAGFLTRAFAVDRSAGCTS
jgi:filamentous hemagglutinin family protein